MKVLVTGATGFVGGRLLRRFGELKNPTLQLIATARRAEPDSAISPFIEQYIAADLATGLPRVSAEVCIHAAGLADDRSSAFELHRANVSGTRNLLDAVEGCRLFIYISSASVYGLKDGPIHEEDATAESALSDYGRSKWNSEHIVREICERRGIRYVILRPRAIYGAGDRVLLPRLMRLMRPPFLLMIGDGRVSMSLTYVEHLASLVEGIVTGNTGVSGVFNVADSAVYELRRVLTALYTAIHHTDPRVLEIPIRLITRYLKISATIGRKAALSRQSLDYLTKPCVLDCSLARDLLGFVSPTTFFDHVSSIAAIYESLNELSGGTLNTQNRFLLGAFSALSLNYLQFIHTFIDRRYS